MDRNYRRNAYKAEADLARAEEYAAATANDGKHEYKKYDRPKKEVYMAKIDRIRFDCKKRIDFSEALNLLTSIPFDKLSLPVYMSISRDGDTREVTRSSIIGNIVSLETTMMGETFAIRVNEGYIENFKAAEAEGLEINIKTFVDADGVPTKLLSFEVRTVSHKS